jgi:hypothetical protein
MTPRLGVAILKNGLVDLLFQHFLKLKRFWTKVVLKMRKQGNNMNDQTVKEIILSMRDEYQKSNKIGKTNILNSLVKITKRDRKHLIKSLKMTNDQLLKKKNSGRPQEYSKAELLPHIQFLWVQMERVSPHRMKAAMKDWLPYYKGCEGYLRMQLQTMSASTLGRYVSEIKETVESRKGISTTCPARYMKNKVPINTLDAKVDRPGFTQTDTVAHCGNSAAGPFISSLTVTDLFSTWTENRAILTKKGIKVRDSFRDVEGNLPFALLAINADSGSEFLNKAMLEFTKHGTRIIFTRSRPYKKNDNCYVEQKNFTHVRELFGYERFEDDQLVNLMNEIYTQYWNPLQNYFLPSMKIKEKIRIGGVIYKKYDAPQTAFTRLINSAHLTEKQKKDLIDKKSQLNPFELKKNLEEKLKVFFEIQRQVTIRKAA